MYIFLYYKPSLIIVSDRNPSQTRLGKSKIYALRHSGWAAGRHRWLKQQPFIFLQFQRLKVPDQGTCMIEFWWKLTTLLADYHGHILTLSSHGLSSVCTRGEREKSLSSSYKGTNPILRILSLCPHLNLIIAQRLYLQILLHWGLELHVIWEHTNIQSISLSPAPPPPPIHTVTYMSTNAYLSVSFSPIPVWQDTWLLNPPKSPISIPRLEMLVTLTGPMFKTLEKGIVWSSLALMCIPGKVAKKMAPPIQPKGSDRKEHP